MSVGAGLSLFVLTDSDLWQIAATLLLGLGAGALTTTFVTVVLNVVFAEQTQQRFAVVGATEASGIHAIYEDRREALPEINKVVERTGKNIDLLAIAGTDFFAQGCALITTMNQWCENDANMQIRVMLLDPRSPHAVERAIIEEGKSPSFTYPTSQMYGRIDTALQQLEALLVYKTSHRKHNNRICIRLYDAAPVMLFVQADGEVFVEQYHCGIEHPVGPPALMWLGKQVPILQFRPGARAAKLYQLHFDYLWEASKTRCLRPGFRGFLQSQMNPPTEAWRNYCEGVQALAGKYLTVPVAGTVPPTL
ncbi:MAG: hypothetical protein Q8O40_01790 [Chloroflexota bacterium]|nr:hypothetical protein [Chloroflexota bacterium]